MPELPEVESVRRRAHRALRGRRIAAVVAAPDAIVFEGVSPRQVEDALTGRRVLAVRRKGKHLWMELDRRPWPLFHFGMTGWFEIYEREEDRPRFWKIELRMDDGTRLAMPDGRRLGRIRLRYAPERESPLVNLGRDLLLDPPSEGDLVRLLARRNAPIKAVLLDQAAFAGVGNWIADEALFQSRIRPDRLASRLSRAEVRRLRSRLVSVVKRAVRVDADSDRFPRGWLFHRRWGKNREARTAAGERIVHHTIGGRTTAWVPSRQR
jgi:formamidopyrimidine-DNA glycosylase